LQNSKSYTKTMNISLTAILIRLPYPPLEARIATIYRLFLFLFHLFQKVLSTKIFTLFYLPSSLVKNQTFLFRSPDIFMNRYFFKNTTREFLSNFTIFGGFSVGNCIEDHEQHRRKLQRPKIQIRSMLQQLVHR
jgi:hypothetical protein